MSFETFTMIATGLLISWMNLVAWVQFCTMFVANGPTFSSTDLCAGYCVACSLVIPPCAFVLLENILLPKTGLLGIWRPLSKKSVVFAGAEWGAFLWYILKWTAVFLCVRLYERRFFACHVANSLLDFSMTILGMQKTLRHNSCPHHGVSRDRFISAHDFSLRRIV